MESTTDIPRFEHTVAVIGAGKVATTDNVSAALSARVVLVTVGDDALQGAVRSVAAGGSWTRLLVEERTS